MIDFTNCIFGIDLALKCCNKFNVTHSVNFQINEAMKMIRLVSFEFACYIKNTIF